MIKKIIVLIICLFLFGTGAVYAGQEEPCDHNNYIVTYNSNDEKLVMFCNDCGETHNFKLDTFFIKHMFKDMWEE